VLRKLAGIAASLAVFFVFGEIVTRWLEVIDLLNGIPHRLYVHTDVPELPYRLNPNQRVELERAVVKTDDRGLRIPDGIDHETYGDGERVLVLGDSVALGLNESWQETFPAQLERILRERYQRRVDVLNSGTPGYSTDAELAYLRTFGLALEPDRVVLQVSLNDFGETPGLNAFGIMTRRSADSPPNWLEEHSEFFLVWVWAWKAARGELWFQAYKPPGSNEDMSASMTAFVQKTHQAFYDAPRSAAWQRIRDSLAGIRSTAREAGIPLTAVVFPEEFQFGDPPYRTPQQRWLQLCDELDIDAIDLWPSFDQAMRDGRKPLFDHVQHPNARGLEVAAEAVAAALVEPH
jgi:lysophospholipase L1-like esterase